MAVTINLIAVPVTWGTLTYIIPYNLRNNLAFREVR